jgi:hypothetical protein
MEKISGSWLFSTLLCQRWRFTRAVMKPIEVSDGKRPPTIMGR